jgi:hypothetical protein
VECVGSSAGLSNVAVEDVSEAVPRMQVLLFRNEGLCMERRRMVALDIECGLTAQVRRSGLGSAGGM